VGEGPLTACRKQDIQNWVETLPSQVHVPAMAPVAEAPGHPSRCQTDPRGKRANALVQLRSSLSVFAAPFMPFMHRCTGLQGLPELDCAGALFELKKRAFLLILPSPSGTPWPAGMYRYIRLS